MRDFLERRRWRSPDLGIGRIGSHQMRKRRLQRVILGDQRVIGRIANLRRVRVMIKPVMLRHLARQAHQTVGGIGVGKGLKVDHAPSIAALAARAEE